jgi:predicted GIY-YIG superfamily endonuclease
MMTNRPNGALYTGLTSDIARRIWSIEMVWEAALFADMA